MSSKFSKGDKIFLSKIKGFVRDFDYNKQAFDFVGFDEDENAVLRGSRCDEVFSNIYQVKFFLGVEV